MDLSPSGARSAGAQPAAGGDDRCPYPRPFTDAFTLCPAFQALRFIPSDAMNRPLAEATTCRHLEVGAAREQRGRFYPRCALGARADRLRWSARVGEERLQAVRALQRELDAFTAPYRQALAEAKSRQYAAAVNGRPEPSLDAELEALLEAGAAFLGERGERFLEAGLPVGQLLALMREWWTAWAVSPGRTPPAGEALDVFPPSPPPVEAGSPERVYRRPGLEIRYRPDSPGLRLAGVVDMGNVEALAQALTAHLNGAREFHVDFGGVEFCDLAGMGELVRAARRLAPGQRLVVHSLPAHLRQAMELVGWDREGVPALVLEAEPA